MRIYGGKDYYDVGLRYGVDKAITLVRGEDTWEYSKSETLFHSRMKFEKGWYGTGLSSAFYSASYDWYMNMIFVFFCGKVYQGLFLDNRSITYREDRYIWTHEGFQKWLQEQDEKVRSEIVCRSNADEHRWRRSLASPADYFKPSEPSRDVMDYCLQHKVSILLFEPPYKEVQVNPYCLNTVDFYKALDPYTAYQELQMWIGGVLGGTSPEIVKITDDKVLAASHGYDKESFRGPRL